MPFSKLPALVPEEVSAAGGSSADGLRAGAYIQMLTRTSAADGVLAGRLWDDFAIPGTVQCTVVPDMLHKFTMNLGLACSLSCCL